MSPQDRQGLGLADALFVLLLLGLFAPFVLFEPALTLYKTLAREHALLLSFLKFAVLATAGELLALRIRSGHYLQPGFGVLPRALVWGLLGVGIKVAFGIFAVGAPAALASLGWPEATEALRGPLGLHKLLVAAWISVTMNLIFAPVMMTLHKISDEHIVRQGGKLRGLLRPLPVADILAHIDWSVMWGFVFKKTIPLFWIPAHTVTFLLPPEYRVLFAAVLGLVLGVLLAVASLQGRPAQGATAG